MFQILVVEDFEAFRQFICSTLRQRAEFQIAEASEGLEAVRKAEQLRPDLILLDIGLPNLNGIEASKRISKLVPNAKILFLSQESSADVVREALNLGAKGYLHKLHAGTVLLPAIDAVLGGTQFVTGGLEFSAGRNGQVHHRHEVIFCSEDGALLGSLAHFIAVALNAGDAAIVWVTESHRKSLLRKLQERGVPIEAAFRKGTFIAADIAEPPDPIRIYEAVRGLSESASKWGKKHPRVAVCGERAGRFWAEGKIDVAIRLEQFFNEFAKSHDIDILCPYPMPHSLNGDRIFKDICAEHSYVSFR